MTSELRRRRGPGAGFTLIETVVALLIVALGMTGVYMQLNQVATNSIYLREKTLASWIASNVVTEYSVQTEWPTLGDRDEEIEYAGLTWLLTIQVSETEVQNLRRVDVSVALEDRPQRIIHKVSGLVEPPMSADFPPVEWREVGRSPRG
jgi:general secretion pathway protein I